MAGSLYRAAARVRNISGHLKGLARQSLPLGRMACYATNAGVESLTTEVEGCTIHYEKVGNGDHTVLLLPGALGSARTDMAPLIEKLNRDAFTVIAWDPPGYGKSRPPAREWPKRFLHRDANYCAKFMEQIGHEKYSAAGWSDGGITALILASANPDNMRKLVVWGSNAYLTAEEISFYEGISDISKWSEKMRNPYIEVYGAEYFQEHWRKWKDAFLVYFMEHKGNICMDDLPNIDCPTLIVHGQKDPLVPQFHPDHLVKNIKGSKLINMPDGKHNLHLRYADEFNKILEEFLLE
ncbi:valacyclovir hydrolase-like [Lineus longissimus]|uniref:valacyclovir hydrolase-like n=1 Tax=Lineus longissimus TaxID=88925 RepID=UPI002B4E9B78